MVEHGRDRSIRGPADSGDRPIAAVGIRAHRAGAAMCPGVALPWRGCPRTNLRWAASPLAMPALIRHVMHAGSAMPFRVTRRRTRPRAGRRALHSPASMLPTGGVDSDQLAAACVPGCDPSAPCVRRAGQLASTCRLRVEGGRRDNARRLEPPRPPARSTVPQGARRGRSATTKPRRLPGLRVRVCGSTAGTARGGNDDYGYRPRSWVASATRWTARRYAAVRM